jgi:hypothetical protein
MLFGWTTDVLKVPGPFNGKRRRRRRRRRRIRRRRRSRSSMSRTNLNEIVFCKRQY